MKSTRLLVSALSLVVCGLFAFSIGLQAQPSGNLRISKATPITDVTKFQSEFTDRLNQGIRDQKNARLKLIAGKKVWRGFVDYFLIVISDKVAKKDLVQLSTNDLQQLRDTVKGRFDEAIRTKKTSSLGEGQITNDFFTGKIFNKKIVTADVKDKKANEKKN